ncbi:MAG: LacI family DNA-binding transcriptional regulator [Armatimonadota bacterium]
MSENREETGTIADGRHIVTLRDIATRCGMDIATVSRALRNDRRRVSAQTIERINALAQEMGYDPAYAHDARRLGMRKAGNRPLNHVIALLFYREFSSSAYHFTLFRALLDVLTREDYGIFTTFNDERTTDRSHPIFARGEVDGIITLGMYPNASRVVRAAMIGTGANDFPVVSIVHSCGKYASVMANDEGGGYAAASHLLDLGHRHLMHFYDVRSDVGFLRLAGYHRAYRERGFDPDSHLHYCDFWMPPEERTSPDWIWKSFSPILAEHPEITGFLAQNDLVARHIYTALQMKGLRVPTDYSLIGFDDTLAIPDAQGMNLLTTVHVPLAEIGTEGAQLILRRIAGEAAPDTHLMLPTQLIVRNSTAPPRPV